MTPERWERLKEIFARVQEVPVEERAAALDASCGDDADLHREVESLMEASKGTWTLLDGPPVAAAALEAVARERPDPRVGSRVGAYTVGSQIGHGGMGSVYRARRTDGQFEQAVAIKFLRRGMDTELVVQRFLREREILARLHHSNIAQLYDGGASEDHLPYFVMEHVAGQPLLDYCRERGLSTPQRLALFRSVCGAVHYAHQNLVVHRDIKPSNILVTSDGLVKLLDFGIAKVLDPAEEGRDRTATESRAMTPDYASPEQLRGEPVTTATDVYSLGVVLYELLTGKRPYRITSGGREELERRGREQEPARPSTVVPRLKGDLDNIVLKAMQKEPQRRYASADELSEDIRRYLENKPVHARPDTPLYRAAKFVRRNPVAVSATALVLAALSAGVFWNLREARRARTAEARAERRFNDVRQLAHSLLFEVHDSIAELSGATPARQLIVRRALDYLDKLARESSGDATLTRELASAYQRVGDVQGGRNAANLGDTAGALVSFRRALALREALARSQPRNPEIQGEVATTLDSIGELLREKGDRQGALGAFGRALGARTAALASGSGGTDARRSLASSYHRMASLLVDQGEYRTALSMWRKEMELFEQLLRENPKDPRAQRNVALSYKYTGGTLEVLDQPAEALELYRKAVALDEARSAADPTNATAKIDLSFSYGALGSALANNGDVGGAVAIYRKALAIREALAAADPKDVNARAALTRAYWRMGFFLLKSGDAVASRDLALKALPMAEALSEADPSNGPIRETRANVLAMLGDAEAAIAESPGTRAASRPGHWRTARANYQKSLEIWTDLRRKGTLSGPNAGAPERVAGSIARCDAALKKG